MHGRFAIMLSVSFQIAGSGTVDVFRNLKTVESTLTKYLAMVGRERRAEFHDGGHLKRGWVVGKRVWRHPTIRAPSSSPVAQPTEKALQEE